MVNSAEVVVVGGGPGGLAAAIAARLQGFDVAVLDAAKPPIDKACGEGLMPDSRAALAELGVDIQPEHGAPFEGIRFVDGARRVEAYFPSGIGVGVRRPVLHSKLIERAEALGVRLFWECPVRGLDGSAVLTGSARFEGRWLVGADGLHSNVRRWAGMERLLSDTRRFGFRRHYRVKPWSPFVEVHWSRRCQCYITPVGPEEVCVAMMTRDRAVRFSDLKSLFPEIAQRLGEAEPATPLRGSLTASRRVASVVRNNIALLGDASGSVDAITGEGLCLAFHQAFALAGALRAGDLRRYVREHRRVLRLPYFMASLMLVMDGRDGLRRRAVSALAAEPGQFSQLLALHVGALGWRHVGWTPLLFSYRFLTA
jgi:2-polyprenyl-6-methoxyphenol hydroxylase-like FAD-dependent oxidoreductase